MYIQAVEESASTILSETKLLYPDKIWEDITVQLFVTFWSLSAYDLIMPSEKYDTEIARIKEVNSYSLLVLIRPILLYKGNVRLTASRLTGVFDKPKIIDIV